MVFDYLISVKNIIFVHSKCHDKSQHNICYPHREFPLTKDVDKQARLREVYVYNLINIPQKKMIEK